EEWQEARRRGAIGGGHDTGSAAVDDGSSDDHGGPLSGGYQYLPRLGLKHHRKGIFLCRWSHTLWGVVRLPTLRDCSHRLQMSEEDLREV
ncbi:unnamed protein product, partial [Urochloa humidicola]